MRTITLLARAAVLAVAACGEDPVDLSEVTEHACLHAEHGPFADVAATALGAPDAANAHINASHTAHRVTLPAAATQFAGSVAFVPKETTDYLVLASLASVTLKAGGNNVAVEQTIDASKQCAKFAKGWLVELQANQTYDIQLGPEASASALVLWEKVEHEH